MRLFIGISLPRAYQDLLEELRAKWSKRFASRLKWTKAGNWHLTLKFIGEYSEQGLWAIRKAMDGVDLRPLNVEAHGGGYFWSRGRIRVAWTGLQGNVADLAMIVSGLNAKLVSCGIPAESRAFKPHLTLFRVKYYKKDDPWNEFLQDLHEFNWPSFNVQSIKLWQSTLTKNGPVYDQLYSVQSRGENVQDK
ncbi:MAG: RNA 2',3'-cyclic phosphodiesterase [Thermodesulfobacteriota bacterium]